MKVDERSYHVCAIKNLENFDYVLIRWWRRKYGIPPKPINDYTTEELYVEFLEDFYEEKPNEAEKFKATFDEPWDGIVSEAHEEKMKEWTKNKHVDLSQFQSDEPADFEEKY